MAPKKQKYFQAKSDDRFLDALQAMADREETDRSELARNLLEVPLGLTKPDIPTRLESLKEKTRGATIAGLVEAAIEYFLDQAEHGGLDERWRPKQPDDVSRHATGSSRPSHQPGDRVAQRPSGKKTQPA